MAKFAIKLIKAILILITLLNSYTATYFLYFVNNI